MKTDQANPLLKDQTAAGGVPVPFGDIKPDHFLPAIESAVGAALVRLNEIVSNPQSPDFENTILALETSSDWVSFASDVFFNLHNTDATEEIHKLAEPISLRLAQFNSEVTLNEALFQRVRAVFKNADRSRLNSEQLQLLDKTHKGFVRNGSLLVAEDKDKLKNIDQELARLGPQFSQNVLKATQKFFLHLNDEAELSGLPASLKEAMKAKAQEKNLTGHVVTLDEPYYVPFLKFSDRADLREQLWRAYNTRAYHDEFDNSGNVIHLANLRHQRAKLLGFKSHAHYVLEERMAQEPKTVMSFLDRLLSYSKTAAQREVESLKAFRKGLDTKTDIQPWDFAYYQEKLKLTKFGLDPEKLKEFFPMEKVLQGAFALAGKLYHLEFKKITTIPVYHPEVSCYQVRDTKNNKDIGLFYTDFFPRATKRSGAWASSFRDQGLFMGAVQRPHAVIVCNFTKPTTYAPSLLNWMEVRTLFHEFGHALHILLSDCTYRSISGTNVYWDFVELPSQFMENWILEDQVLHSISGHYQTDAPLPSQWIAKLREEDIFFAGYASLRQLTFAYLDMAWHSHDPSGIEDVEKFEAETVHSIEVIKRPPGVTMSCSFGHIFAGGYSAGYYSYKWAEVLDADAFEHFKTHGLFNAEVSLSFRENILSKGGSEHPMTLYKRFRGREPDPDSLLRRDKLISPNA